MTLNKIERRQRIRYRIRRIIKGTSDCPRLSVFRSNKEIYAQLIDDSKGVTLAAASSLKDSLNGSKLEQASQIGKKLAEAALSKGISNCVFDRSGYLYHGRVKALAEAAREAGLKF